LSPNTKKTILVLNVAKLLRRRQVSGNTGHNRNFCKDKRPKEYISLMLEGQMSIFP